MFLFVHFQIFWNSSAEIYAIQSTTLDILQCFLSVLLYLCLSWNWLNGGARYAKIVLMGVEADAVKAEERVRTENMQ